MVKFWIQKADFSSQDPEQIDLQEALRKFKAHTWEEELELRNKLESEGKEFCPPGIGFISDGHILHILPATKEYSDYLFHYPEVKKLLGIIPSKKQATIQKENVPFEDCCLAIEKFYKQDFSFFTSGISAT